MTNSDIQKNREELIRMAIKTGAKIEVIDTTTEWGQQFMAITKSGVGAILRWPIYLNEDKTEES